MGLKAVQIRNIISSTLVVIFAALVFWIVCRGRFGGHKLYLSLYLSVIAVLGIVFGLLGIVLVVLTIRLKESGIRKWFFMIMGISAAGILISAILHNVIYGLLSLFFGKEFWGKGGDEPAFFILALLVFPVLFIISAVGNLIIFISSRLKKC